MLHSWLKLSHHGHTGRIRSHEHTSYVPLAFLLLVVGLVLTVFSSSTLAQRPGPAAGSVGLTGSVPGKPPAKAPVILSPSNGQRFSTSPITISGTCEPGTLVEIFKNDIFAGSTVCGEDGRFALDVDLLIGANAIYAQAYNDLNEPGPKSPIINIFYDALPPQAAPLSSFDFGGDQLLLSTSAVFRGVFPGQPLSVPIEIIGGTPPYAVEVRWGDSKEKIIPRSNNLPFEATHEYKKPGTYQISLLATDATDRVAFLTVAAIVNGQPETAAPSAATDTSGIVGLLLMLWPLYTAAAASVVSFWLGEQREKRLLKRQGLLQPV